MDHRDISFGVKSDVFNFGVLILEIVTRKRNSVSYDSEQAIDLLSLMLYGRQCFSSPVSTACGGGELGGPSGVVPGAGEIRAIREKLGPDCVSLLVLEVWEHCTMGTIVEIMDSSMTSHSPGDQMLKCMHIRHLCVQEDPADRPMMSVVTVMLSSNTVSLQAPSRTAFCIQKSGMNDSDMHTEPYPGVSHSTSRSPMSPNEVLFTELEPR